MQLNEGESTATDTRMRSRYQCSRIASSNFRGAVLFATSQLFSLTDYEETRDVL